MVGEVTSKLAAGTAPKLTAALAEARRVALSAPPTRERLATGTTADERRTLLHAYPRTQHLGADTIVAGNAPGHLRPQNRRILLSLA